MLKLNLKFLILKDEDLNMSYHGVVYVDMQPLLYPGATQIKGAYKIHPFQDNEYTTKTKRKIGIADEALRVVSSLYDRNFAVLPVKKDQKVAEKKDNKKVIFKIFLLLKISKIENKGKRVECGWS